MKPTPPRTDADTTKDEANRKPSDERSSAGVTGGAPAAEEDVGTEGAGTEPRDSANVERGTDSPAGRPRGDKNAGA
jgi:hypothetical protein